DPKRIREKALEKGLIGPEHELSDEDLLQLIFEPGFSTAKVVTDISGRGVGMDVVRTNIENLRGRVAIESRLGQGSVFTIELPITLAIIDGIEASVDGKKFIIPTRSVEELVKPAPESVSTTLGHGETLYFRGKFLPLFRLSDVYGLGNAAAEAKEGTALVLRNGHEQAALLVDEIMGSCQTVIKSLDTMVEQAKGFAGCSIMPDGSIGLIVDPRALIDYARTNMRIRSVNSREKNEPGNNGVDLVRSGIGVDE
ncbi:MAG TPA: chemotaxis protein CheW, partial [Oligoflexia bacterium]|nr:chemotaxis protein CheW [Oligoflexia bacterium]